METDFGLFHFFMQKPFGELTPANINQNPVFVSPPSTRLFSFPLLLLSFLSDVLCLLFHICLFPSFWLTCFSMFVPFLFFFCFLRTSCYLLCQFLFSHLLCSYYRKLRHQQNILLLSHELYLKLGDLEWQQRNMRFFSTLLIS